VGGHEEEAAVGYNFRPVERDQQYLMPPSLRDWLPEDDLAWLVIDVVAELDLAPIHARYRADGWGAAAFDPAMMVALLLYAYASGDRSSRRIEVRCRRDIAYRVITANQVPDHATIARFRADHEAALGELFGQLLRICAAAGLGAVGLVALDGTRLGADAARAANRTAAQLDDEIGRILAEAAATDAAEDAVYGPDRRGDELPAELGDRHSRLARLREARVHLATEAANRQATHEQRRVERAEREATAGHPTVGARPGPPPVTRTEARANVTDPDSRMMKTRAGWTLGYNGQAVVAADGLIVASELTQEAADATQLGPMIRATIANAAAAGLGPIGTLVADAGFWSPATIVAPPPGSPALLVAPKPGRRRTSTRKRGDPYAALRLAMATALASEDGERLFRRRSGIVEPVFGQIKEARGIRRFRRRGIAACASEWRLICTTHNLLKLWRSGGYPQRSGGRDHRPPRGIRPARRQTIHHRRQPPGP
jgi:transposase